MRIANNQLVGYTGTSKWYSYMVGTYLTEGTKAFAEKFRAYWILDVIASYQPQMRRRGIEFQFWKFTRIGDGGVIKAYPSAWSAEKGHDEKLLVKQEFQYADLDADQAEIWVKNDIIMLPSED